VGHEVFGQESGGVDFNGGEDDHISAEWGVRSAEWSGL
jgi:hypothetical protein